MKTRDIIQWINDRFNEKISSGSYDDIRRKNLKLLTLADIIISTKPESATNDSRRGYALNPIYTNLVKSINTKHWNSELKIALESGSKLSEELEQKRNLHKVPVILPNGIKLEFSVGKHNVLQKKIIEEFLPIYGNRSEVLYVGDTAKKLFVNEKEKLVSLGFFKLSHDKLPDVITYSKEKNWLYLVEAVHSSGPISPVRLLELKRLTRSCSAEIVYITAFLNRETFRKFVADIAWETEVWIADSPEHLIHWNGHKFLGPYAKKEIKINKLAKKKIKDN
jgi:type II restriction enzyme